ncbi:MAG: phosphotransferase [Verrucomicrobia bacterium]|nr:phosphotransferase [Verrucomicrobiota bacterium]
MPSATEEEAVRATASSSTATEAPTALPINSRQCLNGHDINSGDFICLACGEPAAVEFSEPSLEIASGEAPVAPVIRVAGRWTLGGALGVISGESDLYLATSPSLPDEGLNLPAVFKHYRRGIDPETSLYPALRSLDPDHGLRLLDAGRFEDRAFEVWEYLPLGTLGAIPATEKAHPDFVREVLREVGSALHGLAEVQIIHRDLKPSNLLVRSRSPLDVVLADFSTATVSEFDLQLTITPKPPAMRVRRRSWELVLLLQIGGVWG